MTVMNYNMMNSPWLTGCYDTVSSCYESTMILKTKRKWEKTDEVSANTWKGMEGLGQNQHFVAQYNNRFRYASSTDAKTFGWNAGEQVIDTVSECHTTHHSLITKGKTRLGHRRNHGAKAGVISTGQRDTWVPCWCRARYTHNILESSIWSGSSWEETRLQKARHTGLDD